MKKRLVLMFTPDIVEKPFTYHLVKDYDLVVNILRAKVSPNEEGVLAIAVEGTDENVAQAEAFLAEHGVKVVLWRDMIVRDEERCTHCGACTAVCVPKSLNLNRETWRVDFDEEKCVACEGCVSACPSRAMKVLF